MQWQKKLLTEKEAFSSGPWKKDLRNRLVKCFVWSAVIHGSETWTLRRNDQKQLEAFEIWAWRRMERVKWTDKIKNAVVL